MRRLLSLLCFGALLSVEANASTQLGSCLNNLRQIDAAKEQCAYAKKLSMGTVLKVEWITPYLKRGMTPQCPAGGIYTIGALGETPRCSIASHTLAESQRRGRIKKRNRLIAFCASILIPGVFMIPIVTLRIKRGRFRPWNLLVLAAAWPFASAALNLMVVFIFPSVYAR